MIGLCSPVQPGSEGTRRPRVGRPTPGRPKWADPGPGIAELMGHPGDPYMGRPDFGSAPLRKFSRDSTTEIRVRETRSENREISRLEKLSGLSKKREILRNASPRTGKALRLMMIPKTK